MDPVEFRKINCVKDGDTIVTGMTMHPDRAVSNASTKAAEAIGWGQEDAPIEPE